ncbi:MAG: HPF/RaiA family ribosome-associated protein [Planctomycetes bacterium]|nr:HPF/RaiA family ribosome-associated protein [Planctomycetota bacterium]
MENSIVLVSIHAKGEILPQGLRGWIEDRLMSAVSRLADRGRQVDVYLTDENGPLRAGWDKSCRVVVSIAREPQLVVADRDSNIARMIDRVADRVDRCINKRCAKQRRHRGAPAREIIEGEV